MKIRELYFPYKLLELTNQMEAVGFGFDQIVVVAEQAVELEYCQKAAGQVVAVAPLVEKQLAGFAEMLG